jgi:5-hydroxyisourate hydrolase-like protein (transthyretin family)
MRRLGYGIAIGCALLLAGWLLIDADSDVPDAGSAAHPPSESEPSPKPTAPRAAGESPADADPEDAMPETTGPTRTLHVVDAASDQPLACVRVVFLKTAADRALELAVSPFDEAYATLESEGASLVTDASGAVTIPLSRGTLVAAARDDMGRRYVDWFDAHDDWTLELEIPLVVRARVVDAGGTPVAGVPVFLMQRADLWDTPYERSPTGPDGVAEFDDDLNDELESGKARSFSLTIGGHFAEPPEATVHLRNIPESPIELVLPPTGRVVCTVGSAGEGPRAGREIVLRDPDPPEERHRIDHVLTATTSDEGVAVFEHVALDREFEVTFAEADPDRPDVHVPLPLGAPRPVLTGRIVSAAGEPIPALELEMHLLPPGDDFDMFEAPQCTTDADGRFTLQPDAEPSALAGRFVRLRTDVETDDVLPTTLTVAQFTLPDPLPPTGVELGDLVHGGSSLLLAGWVLDARGEPVAGARIAALGVVHDIQSPRDDVAPVRTDHEGRFELRGAQPDERIWIGVTAAGLYLDGDTSLPAGRSDVTIQLSPAGGLAGSLVLPDDVEDAALDVRIGGPPASNGDAEQRLSRDAVDVYVESDGTFRVTNLRPGLASLRIGLGSDPRIQDIDLAPHVRRIEVLVRDPVAQPLEFAVVDFRRASGPGYWDQSWCDESGRAIVPVPRSWESVELVVTCDEHRSKRLAVAAETQTVVLEPTEPSTIVVRLAPGTALPSPPKQLEAALRFVADGSDMTVAWPDPRDARPSFEAFGEDGAVEFVVDDPGRYQVRLAVRDPTVMFGKVEALETLPTEPIVEIRQPGSSAEISVGIAPPADSE